jgi:hypothetical protein
MPYEKQVDYLSLLREVTESFRGFSLCPCFCPGDTILYKSYTFLPSRTQSCKMRTDLVSIVEKNILLKYEYTQWSVEFILDKYKKKS